MTATWYVTVEVAKSGVLPKTRHPRLTTTFETKAQAMNFAREKLDEGLIVFAGTINPAAPREQIPSTPRGMLARRKREMKENVRTLFAQTVIRNSAALERRLAAEI